MGYSREFLHTHPEHILTGEQATTYESFLQRREHNEPVAYIIGTKEFFGRPFLCDKRALIPRPETEILVERALALLENHPEPLTILELGTGAGPIAITLALELEKRGQHATILATDISSEALELAQDNIRHLNAPEITLLTADMFDHKAIEDSKPFDMIVANLPYVSTTWQTNPAAQPDVIFFEPDVALFGGEDGLVLYRQFLHDAPKYLVPEGHILFEYGEDQTPLMKQLVQEAFPDKTARVYQDYANLDRLMEL
jgi:release factor glutamine methyltransferase